MKNEKKLSSYFTSNETCNIVEKLHSSAENPNYHQCYGGVLHTQVEVKNTEKLGQLWNKWDIVQ